MSALGQKQTFRGAINMSALPPKATVHVVGNSIFVRRTAIGRR
jgi:hypothetical protein